MPLPPRAPEKKLNPELERLVYQAKVIRQEAEGLVIGLSEESLNWQPAPGRWSVAQCFTHLNATNRKMADQIEVAIRRGRQQNQLSEGPFAYGFLARMFLRMTEPPVNRRFKAPAPFAVTGTKPWAEIDAEWRATHDRLDDLLLQANGLDLARIKTKSPASNLFSYSLGMAFWIQAAHDRRHLWQARQVINQADFPKSPALDKQMA